MNNFLKLFVAFSLCYFPSICSSENVKNPYKAMLYSAIIPGGGQFYNNQPLKAAAVIGIQGILIGYNIYDHKQKKYYSDLMNNATGNNYLYYRERRNHYRDEIRNDYWWMGTVLFLSIADAYVDAKLYNFKTEKNKVHLKFSDKLLQLEYNF